MLECPSPTDRYQPIDPLAWKFCKAEAEAYLNNVEDRFQQIGLAPKSILLEGQPAQAIVNYARSHAINQDGERGEGSTFWDYKTERLHDVDGDGIDDAFVPVARTKAGKLKAIGAAAAAEAVPESITWFVLPPLPDRQRQERLRAELTEKLILARAVVLDFRRMVRQVKDAINQLDLLESHYDVAVFRRRHGALLAHHGLADDEGGTDVDTGDADEVGVESAQEARR